ncbi:prolyl oligopeptidase family serine peptidase [uncultured Roseobacter sp.]|uniref:S9 family peptidase n=1 Tax=uncultured Roseobacter sp. TaxID=114847 RepID=UPI002624E7DB|nr:prolyl oligopeptidase family serine peptidase [uncultured Roseobacter sp.]
MTDADYTPYGAWVSPISASAVAAGARSFEQILTDGETICWVETRPDENGRSVLMRSTVGNAPETLTPVGFSARTLVNSYGGGAAAARNGTFYFSNFAPPDFPGSKDQRIYAQKPGMQPRPITPQVRTRYADGVIHHSGNFGVWVCEQSDEKLNGQDKQSLVAIDLKGEKLPRTLVEGADFYACPRLSPDGRKLCWISWDYPSMPWEGTSLYTADIDTAGELRNIARVAGDPVPEAEIDPALNPVLKDALRTSSESILDPKWAPDGTLYFASDRVEVDGTRYWNICRHRAGRIETVTRIAGECAKPLWRLGTSGYGFISDTEMLLSYSVEAESRLARVDLQTGAVQDIDLPWSDISHLQVADGFAAFVGGRPDAPSRLVRLDLTSLEVTEIRTSGDLTDEVQAVLSTPEKITVPTGPDGTEETHAFFYPPCNPSFRPAPTERPPLIIFIHGGPTAVAGSSLSLQIQYFTSRGFAVADVNYRGSTGFGRAYRQKMYGNWGLVDTEDCVAVARDLIAQDRVDRFRIASRGGSSGGYTTLALATFTDLLSAAASYYGISNLEMIATDTDKLEARYAELLVGPWPAANRVFRARSPLFHVDRIRCPMIIFQGLDDPVVPPDQAQVMIDALLHAGLPVSSTFFAGESHGFRMRPNIISSLEQELVFYGAVMGFSPAGHLTQPEISNWP